MMDFIVNHADSNVNGVVFPNSDEKHIHNYIVVGLLKNIEIDIEDSGIVYPADDRGLFEIKE